jgi:hypothetical protein
VESKWKNYHITTFPGQSLSPKTEKLRLEEAMDLSRDRQIEEDITHYHQSDENVVPAPSERLSDSSLQISPNFIG